LKRRGLIGMAFAALALGSSRAEAWPAELSQRIAKDALKLVPRSLAEVLLENEAEIFADARIARMSALPLVYLDLPNGRLSASTRTTLSREMTERVKALQGSDFRAAVIALGATYRLAVDLADPGVSLGLGSDAKAMAIRREFYLFVDAHRDKIPLVVVNPESLRLKLDALPAFLAEVAARTPDQAALLRAEGQEGGRALPFAEIDFKSPVFAVASTAYSRSVSAVAATWIGIWRAAGGDMKRQKAPQIINPRPTQFNPGKPNP
jgi:hypothetical protein